MPERSAETNEAWVTLFEETFFNLMTAMVKAESVEDDYAKLRSAVREKTTQQRRLLSRYAGEYFVKNANPGVTTVSKSETVKLKSKALEFALKKLSDEENK